MSRLYGPQHRELQDHFDSRRMADRIEEIVGQTEKRRHVLLLPRHGRPQRPPDGVLRLQGRAEIVMEGPEMDLFKEGELLVRVAVSDVWMNCPRYVHRYEKVKASRYVPRADAEMPLCEWKRIEGLEDVLRPNELAAVENDGQITEEEWIGHILSGDDKA